MARAAKINWQGDAGFEFVQMRLEGKSYKDIINFFYAKYGVSYTSARMSQINKQFKIQGRLVEGIVNVISN